MKQNGVPLPEDHSLIEPFSRSEDTLFKKFPNAPLPFTKFPDAQLTQAS